VKQTNEGETEKEMENDERESVEKNEEKADVPEPTEEPSKRRRSSRSSATPAAPAVQSARRSTRGGGAVKSTPKEAPPVSKSKPATEPGPMARRSSKRQAVVEPPQTDPKKARVGKTKEEQGTDTPKRGRRPTSTASEVDEVRARDDACV